MDTIRPLTFGDLREGERFRIAPDGPTVYRKSRDSDDGMHGRAVVHYAKHPVKSQPFADTLHVQRVE